MDLSEKLEGVIVEEECSLRPNGEKDAPKKTVRLRFDFSDCSIQDVLNRAVAPLRINFQNSHRKDFDKLADEYTIEVKPVGSRGDGTVSEAKILASYAKMSPERKAKLLDWLTAETVV